MIKLVRSAIKSKFTFNSREIVFNGEGSSSFNNAFARNVVNFAVDNNLSSHTDKRLLTE